jgi:hypothetical protein
MHSTSSLRILLKTLPLVNTCTYQALKNCHSPSEYAMNARDAEVQKLQEYSYLIEKML